MSSSLLHLSTTPASTTTTCRSSLTLINPSTTTITTNEQEDNDFIITTATIATKFDFEAYVSDTAALINRSLDLAVPLLHPGDRLRSAMRYSLLSPGKRIRPILCLASFRLLSPAADHDAAVLPAACSLEMVHAMSLIHDDLPCMDDDSLRRGLPTCHVAFGQPLALLAGDALLALAFRHLSLSPAPAPLLLRAVSELSHCVGSVAAGQAADVDPAAPLPTSLARLEFIHLHKTAALLEAAAVVGAVLAGGTDTQIEKLRNFARRVGLLFQVVDDILDVTKSTQELGKTAGKDLVTEKATYPKLLGLERSREFAAELLRDAKEHLAEFDADKAAPLLCLADYIAYRQK